MVPANLWAACATSSIQDETSSHDLFALRLATTKGGNLLIFGEYSNKVLFLSCADYSFDFLIIFHKNVRRNRHDLELSCLFLIFVDVDLFKLHFADKFLFKFIN